MDYTRGMSATDFKNNQMVIDAVVRNFEIIGEASQKIPASVKERYPEIPRKQMYRLRNLVSHEYFGVDDEMIWKIALDHLPVNKSDLERAIAEERKNIQQQDLGL